MYESFPKDDRERSYGIIPLRFLPELGGQSEVLVIQHLSTGEYGFPKGHAEPTDANPFVAAGRELLEETGLVILRHVFNPYQTYFESTYTNPRTGKIKTTTVWAAEVQGDAKVTIQPEEIMSYAWVGVDNAQHLLSWMEDKEIMQKLVMLLNVETSRSDSMLNA